MRKRYIVKVEQSILTENDSSIISKHKTKFITFGDAIRLIKFDKLILRNKVIKNYKFCMIWPFGNITTYDKNGKRISKKTMTKNKVLKEYTNSLNITSRKYK